MRKDVDVIESALDYLRGSLSSGRRREVEAAVESDEDFRELVSLLREMLEAGESARSLGLVESVTRLAKRLFADFQNDRRSRHIRHGITVYDSQCLPIPDGVRPAAVDTRELRFKLANWDVDVSLHPITADSYELIGRIVGLPENRRIRIMLKSRSTSVTVLADRFCIFRFDRVPAGKYQMYIKDSARVLGIIEIEL